MSSSVALNLAEYETNGEHTLDLRTGYSDEFRYNYWPGTSSFTTGDKRLVQVARCDLARALQQMYSIGFRDAAMQYIAASEKIDIVEQTSSFNTYTLQEMSLMAVSNDAIYAEMQANHRETTRLIGEINSKVSSLIAKYDTDMPEVKEKLRKLEAKPEKRSERTLAILVIVFGAITAIGTWFGPALVNLISKIWKH